MSAPVVRAAGYIRVSTAEQALRGLSLEAQEAEIRRWACLLYTSPSPRDRG